MNSKALPSIRHITFCRSEAVVVLSHFARRVPANSHANLLCRAKPVNPLDPYAPSSLTKANHPGV
jgi:hypothetical protein